LRFLEMAPEGMELEPEPGDEDLAALACRRTTFEWVLRRMALAEGAVELIHGRSVTSLVTADETVDGVPLVVGVTLSDGTTLDADVVVDAGGRRSDVPALLAPHGVEIPEAEEDTGIIYLSRFFRLLDLDESPPSVVVGADLGYLKYGVFPGDNHTFSITFAVGSRDSEMRRLLLDPDRFLTAAALIPATAPYVDGRSEPITDVEVMGGLINRRRWFLDADDRPLVAGFHAVGDCHTATNPLYGRGCSLAMVQAQVLADLLSDATMVTDHVARATAYEKAVHAEVTPWYDAAVAQDRFNRSQVGETESPTPDGAGDATPGAVDPSDFLRGVLREGLLPALRSDPVVLRAFLATFNLLRPPDSLLSDADVIGRVMAVYQTRNERPPEPPLGPTRTAFLAAV
jgi:2-polyprenyl-6-methoxyphenol hydroxylase-like FAD-dependent oxidoreductase